MYIGLSENYNQHNYISILNDTIRIFEKMINETPLPIYDNILQQLRDIKENVVEKQIIVDPDEIDERYSLGGIAAKNFDEDDELKERLFDIFGGACDFFIMDEQ
jgi:hypothetical protein